LLVALVLMSWLSAETGRMDYHRYSGYAMLGALVFRVVWGFVGSRTARFAHFVKGPRAVVAYLRNTQSFARVGHNPLGALSVLAMLGLLLAQVTLGLFSVDVDGVESGPLSSKVSFETGRAFAKAHHVLFDVVLIAVCVHIAAIVFYLIVKRDNLIRPMLSGYKILAADVAERIPRLWMRATLGVFLAALVVWLVV